MKHEKQIVNKFGEEATIHTTHTGNLICPVCGVVFTYTLEWNLQQVFFGATEICGSCKTHFGVSDAPQKYSGLKGGLNDRWEHLRLDWLDKTGWSPDSLRQLRDNLGIDMAGLEPGH